MKCYFGRLLGSTDFFEDTSSTYVYNAANKTIEQLKDGKTALKLTNVTVTDSTIQFLYSEKLPVKIYDDERKFIYFDTLAFVNYPVLFNKRKF